MKTLFVLYSLVAALCIVVLWGVVVAGHLGMKWRRRRLVALRERTLRLLLGGSEVADEQMLVPMFRRNRALTAEIVAELAVVTDLASRAGVARMTRVLRLDEALVGVARRTYGYRRALALQQLSRIEPRREAVESVSKMLYSRNRYVRFYALMCHIAAQPTRSLHIVATLPDRLNGFEVAELTSLIFRGGFPVAYAPMLVSPYVNLRLLGLAIVRRIGADEVARQLIGMASSDPDRLVASQALQTIVALRLPLAGSDMARALSRLTTSERKLLYRRLAREGYSVRALTSIFHMQERQYFESLVCSYKSRLS